MNSPRYHANKTKKASSVIRRTVIRAESRFKPELNTHNFVGDLVKRGLITREQGHAVLGVKDAKAFQDYCASEKINAFVWLRSPQNGDTG